MSKKSKKNAAVEPVEQPAPNTNVELVNSQERLLGEIDALIKMVQGTGDQYAKIVRPFKKTAEEKLRMLGWAVLNEKMVANMTRLNSDAAAKKLVRDKEKAEAEVKKAQERAAKVAADAAERLAAAEARVNALKKAAGVKPDLAKSAEQVEAEMTEAAA